MKVTAMEVNLDLKSRRARQQRSHKASYRSDLSHAAHRYQTVPIISPQDTLSAPKTLFKRCAAHTVSTTCRASDVF